MSLDLLLKGQLSFLNKFYEVIAVSGEDPHLENVRNRENVRTIGVSIQRQISPLKDLISLYQLYRVFKKEKPFIVHSMTPKAGLLSMVAAYFAGVPHRVHTFTGLIFPSKTGLMKQLLIMMDRVLCAFATQVYPEGLGVKNDLLRYKITSKPLHVIANGNVNGIDTTFFSKAHFSFAQKVALRESLQLVDSDFVFVFVGRLVSDKGINEAVRAFKKISITYPHAKFLLVGPLESDLDPLTPETLEAIQHCSGIISVGYQHDVRPYLAISDCLVFPSYREGFPNVVMQAGAMELPSIVSDINGCNEIIIQNKNGLIIPPKSEQRILDAMQLILDNAALRLQMKSNSRSMIVERYEQKVVWQALLAEYQKMK
ncbi:glycosyltransferase involved in cell wall biosynthesis [Flavobacterium lacus]|uniref:Glycosyltransferase involved in cell wall biosynthesis n=2 Tax=Flavobacterium lacus TaxID=1353778 RepID=A0A328WXW9_9FLAO|nr:glycosyltransferase involved in cell wall biosynthesis [Flavobacterium lacus]